MRPAVRRVSVFAVDPLRVVIIDDHPILRAACRALLRTEGVDVIADVDGDAQSLETVRRLNPDLVIVDISPGSPSAIEIARRIRALDAPPRVVMTACDAREPPDGFTFIAKADICAGALGRE
jgi:DNA-binding NarL/FixJ family response regulator